MIRKRNLSWVKANLCQMKVNLRILFFLALGNAGVMVGMVDRQNFPNYHLKCTGITSYFLGGVDPPPHSGPPQFFRPPPRYFMRLSRHNLDREKYLSEIDT